MLQKSLSMDFLCRRPYCFARMLGGMKPAWWIHSFRQLLHKGLILCVYLSRSMFACRRLIGEADRMFHVKHASLCAKAVRVNEHGAKGGGTSQS